jgi:hypothetical protein
VESALLGEENVRMIAARLVRSGTSTKCQSRDKEEPSRSMPSWRRTTLCAPSAAREPGRAHDFPPPPVAGRLLEQQLPHPRGRVRQSTIRTPRSTATPAASSAWPRRRSATVCESASMKGNFGWDARERELAATRPDRLELNAVDRGADRQHLARHTGRLEERQGARVHDERSGLPAGLFSRFDQSRGTASPGQEQGGAEPRRAGAHDDRQFQVRHTKSPRPEPQDPRASVLLARSEEARARPV